MYIADYLTHLRELVLATIFQGKLNKKQFPSVVYLHWCLDNFPKKNPDSYIRIDFKKNKKSNESLVLVFDVDGITFSLEGNSYSPNGHDGYSYNYGQIRRDGHDNFLNEFHQRFSYWFESVSDILEIDSPYLDVEYSGKFKRNIDFNPETSVEIDLEDQEEFNEEINGIEELTDVTGTWLFKYGNEDSLRFILGKKGRNTLFVIGLNPSTANHTKLDPTANSINRIATNAGFDSWIILNLYPLRSTDPYALPHSIDLSIHKQNLNSIQQIFEATEKIHICAAWGNLIELRPYLIECLIDIHRIASAFESSWYSFGKITKKGHPRHPLYLNSKIKPKPFEIKKYLFG